MRFGLYLPNQGEFADAGVLADVARDAEDAGWDGVFIWDEIVQVLPTHDGIADALIALTAMAVRTERIQLGALVTPLARLRPESFAVQTATLDRLSGGRLVVGVGLGNPGTQFSAFGGPGDLRTRAEMVDEFLALLVALWSGERVSFDGRHYQAHDVALASPPADGRQIPIWVGADSHHRAPRRRAARWDGFAPASEGWPDEVIPAAEYREMVDDIRSMRASDDPFDVVVIGNGAGTVPAASSLADYEEAGVTWLLVQALTAADAADRLRAGPPA